jgi:hypothetical protein
MHNLQFSDLRIKKNLFGKNLICVGIKTTNTRYAWMMNNPMPGRLTTWAEQQPLARHTH